MNTIGLVLFPFIAFWGVAITYFVVRDYKRTSEKIESSLTDYFLYNKQGTISVEENKIGLVTEVDCPKNWFPIQHQRSWFMNGRAVRGVDRTFIP